MICLHIQQSYLSFSESYSELSWIVCGSFLNRALHGLKVLFGGKAAPEARTTNCLQATARAKRRVRKT